MDQYVSAGWVLHTTQHIRKGGLPLSTIVSHNDLASCIDGGETTHRAVVTQQRRHSSGLHRNRERLESFYFSVSLTDIV